MLPATVKMYEKKEEKTSRVKWKKKE